MHAEAISAQQVEDAGKAQCCIQLRYYCPLQLCWRVYYDGLHHTVPRHTRKLHCTPLKQTAMFAVNIAVEGLIDVFKQLICLL